jgi:hypothetical protein
VNRAFEEKAHGEAPHAFDRVQRHGSFNGSKPSAPDSEHDGPIFSNLAKKSLTTGASSRSPTSPTSRSRPVSFISVRSWTLGYGELSAMRSVSGSTRVGACRTPGRHRGTPTATGVIHHSDRGSQYAAELPRPHASLPRPGAGHPPPSSKMNAIAV